VSLHTNRLGMFRGEIIARPLTQVNAIIWRRGSITNVGRGIKE